MYLLIYIKLTDEQEQDDAAEKAGPRGEIEFWRSRTADLGGIRDQLDDKSKLLTLLGLLHASFTSRCLHILSGHILHLNCIIPYARSVLATYQALLQLGGRQSSTQQLSTALVQ